MNISRGLWDIVAVGLLLTIVSTAAAKYSGGTGEPNDPHQIATAADLIALGEDPNDYGKHFLLTADIDLDPSLPGRRVFDRAVIAPDVNDTRSGHQGPAFTGFFDGNRHVIRNLRIRGGGFLGLFGRAGPEAKICNLGLEAVDAYGTGEWVGGLVGCNGWYGGSIINCYSTGTVRGTSDVGGLVGYNTGTITTCYSTALVNGRERVGGFVGYNCRTITDCRSSGPVSGQSSVGGLAGDNSGSITNCYSTGSVSGSDSVGGLVGGNSASIMSSCWDTDASGIKVGDGGVGLTTAEMMDPEMLGLNGFASDPNWVLDAGHDYPRLAWEGTAGQIIPEPVIDWLDGQGTEQNPYRIDTADQLSFLGRASVLWDKYFVLSADIDLDPNLPGRRVFSQAVIPLFSGAFDGNGHTISHLTIRGGKYLGLFGQTGSEARICNLGLQVADVNGTSDYVGALVGANSGSIITCYSTGLVSGQSSVGGLVASNGGTIANCYSSGAATGQYYVGGLVAHNGGSITNCYSSGPVSGQSCVGGLVGYNSGGLFSFGRYDYYDGGSIANCYSTGSVTGQDFVGGLAGSNEGSITNCYSSGPVSGQSYVGGLMGGNSGSIMSSCWDTDASGIKIGDGGVGLTTAEMMDPEMLGLNGFASDPNWVLDAGHDYPRLAWEGTAGQIIPQPTVDWLDGQGTEQEPYRVDTADQLILLGRASVLWDKYFVLGADIDLDPNLPGRRIFSQAPIQVFSGAFDGNGHTILHLTIRGSSYPGLFGQIAAGARISNLGLEAVDVNGTSSYVGGLVGENYGSITNCYSSGTVSGQGPVGGLVALNHDGSITNCHSSGTVSGQWAVGGLVGGNGGYIDWGIWGSSDYGGSITNCYSTASVNAGGSVGGLVGRNDREGCITTCYSSGPVSGQSSVGGLVGDNSGSITNCYSTARVIWQSQTWVFGWLGGGLVGWNGGSISTCYSAGGAGLASSNSGSITSSYWHFWSSEHGGGTGLATAEMQTASTFLDAGWDFVGETVNGSEDIWWIDEGKDYPRLWWEGTAARIIPKPTVDWLDGEGTEQEPYRIDTADQLILLGRTSALWDKHFVLGADIDLDPNLPGRQVFSQAVISFFWGVFDGNGHTISHLTIRGDSYLGLFGRTDPGARISNLGLEAVDVNGTGDGVGGLVYYNSGRITNCYSTGSISGSGWYVGGLVGENREGSVTHSYSIGTVSDKKNGVGGLVGLNFRGALIQCYSSGVVSGDHYVGGLVGEHRGTLTQCYSSGTVSGQSSVGGVVGQNAGSITNCYSSGPVNGQNGAVGGLVGVGGGSITSSFWDTQTSGQKTSSGGGSGLTTAEMQTASTFLDAGWDFVGETVNGSEDIWWIDEGKDYPRLWWELIPEN